MGAFVRAVIVFVSAQFIDSVSTSNGLMAFPRLLRSEEGGNEVDSAFSDFSENDTSEVYFNLMVEEGVEIPICVENSSEYLKSVFKYDAETKFIVHGWLSSEDSMAVKGPAHEYFKVQRGNVVRVDWSYDASWKFYPMSALQVAYIAGVISNFINKLLFIKAFELQRLHLIGHSLGAHVMGITGSYLDEGRPARITGLDPAKPGFEGTVSDSYRLDKSDGHFVDVIHSAAGAAGFVSAIGHVDFYPNGGSPPQPGCFDITAPWQLSCSHGRAYDYFTESISTPEGFPAVECDSWSNFESGACDKNKQIFMGPNTPTTARGVYYLSTNGGSPFAKRSIH